MRTPNTLVKNTHRLIRTPNLHLHKIRLTETTRGTYRHGPIDILPSVCSAQYAIDLLSIGGKSFLDLGCEDRLGVGAGGAGEDVSAGCGGGGVGVGDYLEEGAV